MVIGPGRRREHPKDTSKGVTWPSVTTDVAQHPFPHAHTQGNPEGVKWPSVTSGSHVTTVLLLRKKARGKPRRGKHDGTGKLIFFIRGGIIVEGINFYYTWVVYGHSSSHVCGGSEPEVTSVTCPVRKYVLRNFRDRIVGNVKKKQRAVPSVDKLLLKHKKLHVLRDIQYGPLLFFFNSTVSYT
jgi:hypothetical protein